MKYVLSLLTTLLPVLAQAQTGVSSVSQYDPNPSSKALSILASIFGNLGVFGPSGGDPFSSTITFFNGAVLSVGGLLIAYSLILGIVGTAQDGEMLGKKLHSAWWPIRTALGTALVLPVVNGGYCGIQVIVGMIITTSIGIADKTWTQFVSTDNLGKNLAIGLVRQDSKQLGYTILKNYVCLASLSKATQTPEAQVLGGNNSSFGISREDIGTSIAYKFGDMNEQNSFKRGTCGTVTVQKTQEVIEYPVRNGIWKSPTVFADSKARMERVSAEHLKQLAIMMEAMQAQANTLVGGAALSPTSIDGIVNKYELAVRDTASKEVLSIDAFKEVSENASQDGFVGMATFYVKLNFLTDIIQRTMAKVPTASPPAVDGSSIYKDQYALDYAKLLEIISKTQKGQAFGISFENGASNNQKNGDWSWTDIISKDFDINLALKSMFTNGRSSIVLEENEHPVMAVKRLGNELLAWAGAGYAGSLVAMVGASAIPGIGGGISNALAVTMLMFVPMLSMGGFVLSYVVPFAPTVLIISAIIGWTIMCVEAIIIAPLWAVMHLSPKGDDMVGTASQGYRLLLNLLCKPVLLVFGVVTSIVLLPIFGNLVSAIFLDTFISLNEDSNLFVMLASMLFSSLIYGGLVFMVIKRLFNVIHELPDNVLKWITNSENTLGSSAKQIAGDGGVGGGPGTYTAAAAGAVGQTSSIATSGIRNQLGKIAGDRKNLDSMLKEHDQRVLEGLKNSNLPEDEKQKQAETYGEFRKQLKSNPTLLKEVSRQAGMSQFKNMPGMQEFREGDNPFVTGNFKREEKKDDTQ